MSLSNLAAMGKVQKNAKTKVRPVGQININTIAAIFESGLLFIILEDLPNKLTKNFVPYAL